MPLTIMCMRGQKHEWDVQAEMSNEQIADLRAVGHEIGIVENIVPVPVAEAGGTRVWCFMQDLWNFKNPFRN